MSYKEITAAISIRIDIIIPIFQIHQELPARAA